jgi:hypothetical protein
MKKKIKDFVRHHITLITIIIMILIIGFIALGLFLFVLYPEFMLAMIVVGIIVYVAIFFGIFVIYPAIENLVEDLIED